MFKLRLIPILLSVGVTHASMGQVVTSCPDRRVYTSNEDFEEGMLVNLNLGVSGQLQVNKVASTFPFIWVAASARGTIIKINTETGEVLGEYLSAPNGLGRNPSRTTVDQDGAVWAGNRDEAGGGKGSVVQIALFESGDCQDRNGNGVIDTSTGLGDIRPWPNPGGVDSDGGVASAEDECITKYLRVEGDYIRHVSVDNSNNVWVAGNFGNDNTFELIDNQTGAILASFDVGAGGYGGLVDSNGVLWSSNRGPGPFTVLRYDTKNTVATEDDTFSLIESPNPYGLAVDGMGNVWNSEFTNNSIRKWNAAGQLFPGFPVGTGGASGDRGTAVTPIDNNVWIANSGADGGSDVSRMNSDGTLVKVIPLGSDGVTPTGVAVDALGKVWATCRDSNTVKRIDPTAGADELGAVDLTVSLGDGAGPYNYSDMTGLVILGSAAVGTWTVIHDGGIPGSAWSSVAWNSDTCDSVPNGAAITVEVRAADKETDLGSQVYQATGNGERLSGVVGRFIQVRATLNAAIDPFASPSLCDLTINGGCQALGDLNCNAEVDAEDLSLLLGEWSSSKSPADLNGDGLVDGGDLGLLLGNWGRCSE